MASKEITISSITSGPRQSNFELLRIVAMFLVLILHADFLSIGGPKKEQFFADPSNAWMRTVIESCSIVAVNVFVLISGWFGIKPSLKGIFSFIFQCVYFYTGIFIVMYILGEVNLSAKSLVRCLLLIDSNWFIASYLGLYIIAPLLNSFLKYSNKQNLEIFLLAFYSFQTLYGWMGHAHFVGNGYSTFSFIGLYILARYIRQYGFIFQRYSLITYTICVILISILYFCKVVLKSGINTFVYINPLIVIASVFLLISFSRIKIGSFSQIINWVAKSSFAVFLLHINPLILEPIYEHICKNIYDSYHGVKCLMAMLVFICLTFITGVIIDQPRIILNKYLTKKLSSLWK